MERTQLYGKNVSEQDVPVLDRVLDRLDTCGLGYSTIMGRGDAERGYAVIVEGGLSDYMKALRTPGFIDAVTDGTGMANRGIVERNSLKGRRILLENVVKTLQEQGATLTEKEQFSGLTVDGRYELEIEGRKVQLMLMPR